jgi:hypothetical protein
VQHLVEQTPVLISHPVQPFCVMQTPRAKSLQSASMVQAWVSAQNMSSAQKHLRSPNRMKQKEPSPTSLLHVPHWPDPQKHWSQHAFLQSLCAFLFVQRSTDADARELFW